MKKFKTFAISSLFGLAFAVALTAVSNVAMGGGGDPWDGYSQSDCRIFVTQYPSQNAACEDSAIIKSCNQHLSTDCKDCN